MRVVARYSELVTEVVLEPTSPFTYLPNKTLYDDKEFLFCDRGIMALYSKYEL